MGSHTGSHSPKPVHPDFILVATGVTASKLALTIPCPQVLEPVMRATVTISRGPGGSVEDEVK